MTANTKFNELMEEAWLEIERDSIETPVREYKSYNLGMITIHGILSMCDYDADVDGVCPLDVLIQRIAIEAEAESEENEALIKYFRDRGVTH